jgi:hypothetical protein
MTNSLTVFAFVALMLAALAAPFAPIISALALAFVVVSGAALAGLTFVRRFDALSTVGAAYTIALAVSLGGAL